MPGKKGSLSKMNEGILRRSKQDIKSAMKAIFVYHEHPEQWAKLVSKSSFQGKIAAEIVSSRKILRPIIVMITASSYIAVSEGFSRW